jgi:hypothetical protein
MSLGSCLGSVAPLYNLVLVVFVIILFIRMLKNAPKRFYSLPWKLLLFALSVYVVEEVLTIFEIQGFLSLPDVVFPIFETVIITSATYMLLLQKRYDEKNE